MNTFSLGPAMETHSPVRLLCLPSRIRDCQLLLSYMTGEIIDGELIVSPRPARKHVAASSALVARIIPPYWFGRGGRLGGWIILVAPEIGFG